MIPDSILQHLADLKSQADMHEFSAADVRAEIRGMETVIEAWRLQETQPVPAQVAPKKRRDVRGMVLDIIRREPGLSVAQIRDRVKRVDLVRIENAVAHWATKGEIVCGPSKPERWAVNIDKEREAAQ